MALATDAMVASQISQLYPTNRAFVNNDSSGGDIRFHRMVLTAND